MRVARTIAQSSDDPVAAYRAMVDLYSRQPLLNTRSSESIEQQAYSTPAPLAYLAQVLGGVDRNTTVYEPSAGHGMLVTNATRSNLILNELNDGRRERLSAGHQGAVVTGQDASQYAPGTQVDVVIANPPFGPVKDADGNNIPFHLGGNVYSTDIDAAISMKALEAMRTGGRAVLIVGSVNKQAADKAKAYGAKQKRHFYYRLYNDYNVVDHFTVSGDLYARQGASWPVDVIVIDGRGKSARLVPAAAPPRQYDSWEALGEILNDSSRLPVQSPEGIPEPSRQPGPTGPAGLDEPIQEADLVPEPGPEREPLAGDDQPGRGVADVQPGEPDGAGMGAGETGAEPSGIARPGGTVRGVRPAVRPDLPDADVPPEQASQVAYQPGNGQPSMDTLVPANMATAISGSRSFLKTRTGDLG